MQFSPTLSTVNAIRESRFTVAKRANSLVGPRRARLRRKAAEPATIVCVPSCVTA